MVIPVLTQHYATLQRNLLYTGITRGKRLAVAVAVSNVRQAAVVEASGMGCSVTGRNGQLVTPARSRVTGFESGEPDLR